LRQNFLVDELDTAHLGQIDPCRIDGDTLAGAVNRRLTNKVAFIPMAIPVARYTDERP
jgi:hypothetical protein